jgi:hypothetical protein
MPEFKFTGVEPGDGADADMWISRADPRKAPPFLRGDFP